MRLPPPPKPRKIENRPTFTDSSEQTTKRLEGSVGLGLRLGCRHLQAMTSRLYSSDTKLVSGLGGSARSAPTQAYGQGRPPGQELPSVHPNIIRSGERLSDRGGCRTMDPLDAFVAEDVGGGPVGAGAPLHPAVVGPEIVLDGRDPVRAVVHQRAEAIDVCRSASSSAEGCEAEAGVALTDG